MHRHIDRSAWLIAVICWPLAAFADSPRCPAYAVEVIEAAPCPFNKDPLTIGAGIANGTVVGYYSVCFTSKDRAFMADVSGTFVTLPLLPGFTSMKASDLNDAGDAVGLLETSTGVYHAFLYSNGVVSELPIPAGYSGAQAIRMNNTGTIVGASFAPSAPEATVWVNGVATQLTLPLGPDSEALDVNDSGTVVGWMGWSLVDSASAFQLDLSTGRLTNLGHLPDGTGIASAINGSGEIAGWGVMPAPPGKEFTTRGIRWSGGRMEILEPLPGFKRSGANDISDDGEIVGFCWNSPPFGNAEIGFIWRDGVMTALDDLIPPESGVSVKIAYAIDDEGRITGLAEDERGDVVAVRLTPFPTIEGDLNRDDAVEGTDLGILLGAWGLAGLADIDGSGAVDGADLGILLGNWTG
jgi:probable HAF family extracellular repeat protein